MAKPHVAAGKTTGSVDWTGISIQRVTYDEGTPIFVQGDAANTVMFLEEGTVRLSVLSQGGKEAVVAVLDRGQFFGEGSLVGQPYRMATATTIVRSEIIVIDKQEMSRQLRLQPVFAERFLRHMLTRNIRIEEDLVDHLFNSSEKRLARTLLLLARFGEPEADHRVLPKVSQAILAEMVGTTRSRVNFFMNKFRKLGFVEYNGEIKVNDSLLTVVLHDDPAGRARG